MKHGFDDLCRIIEVLNSEGGCPWDRAQTFASLRGDLLEECCEALDAVDNGDMDNLEEELGDILYLVVFYSKLAHKDGLFTIADVIDRVCRKLVSRHTHIFSESGERIPATELTQEEALQNWERAKGKERGDNAPISGLRAVPRSLPALVRSEKVLKRAGELFGTPTPGVELIDNLEAMLHDIKALILSESGGWDKKIGDFLLTLSKLSVFIKINAEFALTKSIEEFIYSLENIEFTRKDDV